MHASTAHRTLLDALLDVGVESSVLVLHKSELEDENIHVLPEKDGTLPPQENHGFVGKISRNLRLSKEI